MGKLSAVSDTDGGILIGSFIKKSLNSTKINSQTVLQ